MNERKEFYSINEIEKIVQRNRGTIYNRIKMLGIETHKFEMDRHTYVSAADVERIKTVVEKPWMAEELKKKPKEDHDSGELSESVA